MARPGKKPFEGKADILDWMKNHLEETPEINASKMVEAAKEHFTKNEKLQQKWQKEWGVDKFPSDAALRNYAVSDEVGVKTRTKAPSGTRKEGRTTQRQDSFSFEQMLQNATLEDIQRMQEQLQQVKVRALANTQQEIFMLQEQLDAKKAAFEAEIEQVARSKDVATDVISKEIEAILQNAQ